MGKILVVGSINMDVIISLDSVPKAGESLLCKEISYACGGKGANQAGAVARLGLDTIFFGAVGNDSYGIRLQNNLKENKIDSKVRMIGDQSGIAYVLLEANGENRIIVSSGANEKITPKDIECYVKPLLKEVDMVMIQLEIPLDCVEQVINIAKEQGVRVFVDAGPVRSCDYKRFKHAWCVSPNETELGALLGREIKTEKDMILAAEEFLDIGVECVLIKLGEKGCFYLSKEKRIKKDSYKVNVVDTTAAGDSFSAGFVKSVLDNKTIEEALIYANKCGAIAVTKKGAGDSLPTKEAVENFEKLYLL